MSAPHPPPKPPFNFEQSFINKYQAALIDDGNVWTHELPPLLPNATLLGKADQALIRAFALAYTFQREVERLASLVEKQDDPKAREKALGNLGLAKLKFETMNSILKIETAQRFPQIWNEKKSVGVYLCEDWQVAAIPINIDEAMAALIGMLLPPP